ncbi:HybD peptidase [Halobacillus andaensis]|uniref:HybD peptidase n=1 Tax=Halobacillus andaensis TaxID=1176239 RepID=A0A917EVL3_HALAA|nr:hydrogenase maturation protease [Halobacillus andaensis]MBP2004828.1 hydrogenase maturation protease [Halobacillus andaensis]GGF18591.1 HybD peptidase [Halobacillus andaensis]
MEKIIVLGIGNQLMMDDGIGIYLVEQLAKRDHPENVEYLIGESDIDYCLQQIEDASFVIILDTVCTGLHPGDITLYPIEQLHEKQPLDLSPHNVHLFQSLYLQKDRIQGFLIGVEPHEIKFHIGLSAPINEIWRLLLEKVQSMIEDLIKNESAE